MANEILVLEGNGERDYALLFLYPIAAPAQVTPPGGSATNVVPTPSSLLPSVAVPLLSTPEKAALDAGTAAFEVVNFTAAEGLSGAELIARAQDLYTRRAQAAAARYEARYRYIGTRLSAS